jgi:hypothetical protein
MENLTKVTLQIDKIPLEMVSASCGSVRKLYLWGENGEPDKSGIARKFQVILGVFPSVQDLILEMNCITKSMILNLNEMLKNLERLRLPIRTADDQDFQYFDSIHLPNLKCFEYGSNQTVEEWEVFIKKHPNIENFFTSVGDLTDQELVAFDGWKNLKVLKFKKFAELGNLLITEKSFDTLVSDNHFGNLKRLHFWEVSTDSSEAFKNLQTTTQKYRQKLDDSQISIFFKHTTRSERNILGNF